MNRGVDDVLACWWWAGMVWCPEEGEAGAGLGTGSRLAHQLDTLVASFVRLSLASAAPICNRDHIVRSGSMVLSSYSLDKGL